MLKPFRRKVFAGAMVLAAALALDAGLAASRADDDTGASMAAPDVAGGALHRTVRLGLDKSLVIDLPRDARDILVSNPDIADAVIRTPRRIYLTGKKIGQANLIVFDRAGQGIVTLDLSVERDNIDLSALIRRLVPDSDVTVDIVSDNIILSGTVKNAGDAKKVADIASAFANGGSNVAPVTSSSSSAASSESAPTGSTTTAAVSNAVPANPSHVVNMLTIAGDDQVQIKVTVAEVQRNVIKQLGVDLNGAITSGDFKAAFASINPFPVAGTTPSSGGTAGSGDPNAGISNFNNGIFGTLRALEQTGMVRTLAEPTLTAISGESASFLAGGEFPVPTGFDQDTNTVTVTFKQFGVALAFTPIVLDAGRISLHVKTEVSDISTENSVSLGGGIAIPSLVVRRSESVMELPSGGAMVMAGLLQDNIRQTISGFPGLTKLPILGTLFRSRDFKRNETELVIIVTPYLVKPVARTALAQPDDGFAPASDATSNFLGRLNRVYGVKGKPAPAGGYAGKYGFIFE